MKNRFTSFWSTGLLVLCGIALAATGLTLAGCYNGAPSEEAEEEDDPSEDDSTNIRSGIWMVTTFAGSASGSTDSGYADGTGPAARFREPHGITIDSAGNLYVADTGNSNIRKITPAGVVTTFAGSTVGGFAGIGDADETGAWAHFNQPRGITIDSAGTLYVADTGNHKIRTITPAGQVTTFAGDGTPGATDGTGTAARFNEPHGITVDSAGTILYVADTNNNNIRKILISTGEVTTFAGSTSGLWNDYGDTDALGTAARFRYPKGITVDSAGILYVADTGNNKIRKITPAGQVTTFAGSGLIASSDGMGTAARFNNPCGITVDRSGTLYVANTKNNRIRKITPAGMVTTIAGDESFYANDGKGGYASFYNPYGITIDSAGTLYVADTGNHKIRKITLSAGN
jgi:sugar lactone lactonase YvrE